MNWLVKEEPTHYNFDNLVRDGRTAWTGVKNPVAQKNLQAMREGDLVFFYHTGDVTLQKDVLSQGNEILERFYDLDIIAVAFSDEELDRGRTYVYDSSPHFTLLYLEIVKIR